jgi:hypothetical protein
MQPFVFTNLGKGVMVAGGLWGLRSVSQQQKGNSAERESLTALAVPSLSCLANKSKSLDFKFAFNVVFMEARSVLLDRYTSNLRSIDEIIGEVKKHRVPLINVFLPTVAECEGQPDDVQVQHTVDESIVKQSTEGSNVPSTSSIANIKVLLYDANVAHDSILLRGCHVLLSWTVFASLWSSVILFPVLTLWKIYDGAWGAVASIAGSWLCSLMVRLPSSDGLRRFLFRGMHKWFPHVDIIYEGEPPVDKTIFCSHPHGVFSVGTALLLDDLNYRKLDDDTNTTREVVLVAAPFLRWCNPIFKCLTDLVGIHIHGAGKTEFRELLESGKSFTLVPGGFSEATITCVGKERIYINDRKGFIKYALRAGYSLTPVYVFGESDLYHNPQSMLQERLYLNTFRFQIPGVLPFGHPLAPLAPRRVPLRIVCGRPLQLPLITDPTEDDIHAYHAQYVEAVEDLYNRHVDGYHDDVYCKYVESGKNDARRVLERW